MEIVRRYKSYDKRTLVIYDDKKPIAYVRPFSGWFSIEVTKPLLINEHIGLRIYIMENLYWLLGKDCNEEEWCELIDKWDSGKHVYGVPVDKLSSMFFEGEKEIALNSFEKL